MLSIVIPVHNEQRYLPYFIWGLKKALLTIDEEYEAVFSLDRCKDRSKEIITKYMPQAKILIKGQVKWKNPCAENFDYAIRNSKGDVIYVFAADLIVDPKVFKYFRLLRKDKKVGVLSFNYVNYDPFRGFLWRVRETYYNLLKRILNKISPYRLHYHSGIYAIRRDVYLNIGGLRDVPSEYDDLLYRIKKHGYRHIYVRDTKIVHLRPGFSDTRQRLQGISRAQLGYPLWKVIAHALLYMKMTLLRAYIQERKYKIYEKRSIWRK